MNPGRPALPVRCAALLALAIAAAAQAQSAPPAAQDLLARVNQARRAQGVEPLRLEAHLTASAQRRAEEQARAGLVSNSGDAEGVLQRVKRQGYEANSITELLAESGGGVGDIFTEWRTRSTSSYRELLEPAMRDLGAGEAQADGVTYVALLLGLSWQDFFQAHTRGLQDLAAVRAEMLRLTNDARHEAKRPPLRLDVRLVECAQRYAELMLQRSHYGHRDPSGGTVRERAMSAGYPSYSALGENIAEGQFSVGEVMAGWMNSPGHRENLLSPMFTEAGFGVAFGHNDAGWQVLWVQCFGHPAAP